MPYKTIKTWFWGGEGRDETICFQSVWKDQKKARFLVIPKGGYVESATLGFRSYTAGENGVDLEINDVEVFHVRRDSRHTIEDTIDITTYVKPPPMEWGTGRNAVRVRLYNSMSIFKKQCFDFRLFLEAVIFVPEAEPPDAGEPYVDPYWSEGDENGLGKGCLAMAMLGTTFVATTFFPYIRMFRDAILPTLLTRWYYSVSTSILRMCHVLG